MKKDGNYRGNEKDIYEWTLKLVEEYLQFADLFLGNKFVRSIFFKTFFDVAITESVFIGIELLKSFFYLDLVPAHRKNYIMLLKN